MSTPEKLSSHLSQATSEIPQGDDIEAMIARLDKKWGELKKLLRAEEDANFEEQPDLQFVPVDDDTGESWSSSPLTDTKAHFQVTSEEAGAIIKRVEKLDEETRIREHLVKVQWQNRGLAVYSIICTIMFLYMLFSVFFSLDGLAVNTTRTEPGPQVAADAKTQLPPKPTPLVAGAPVPLRGDGVSPSPPPGANTPASAPGTPGMTAVQKFPTVISTTTAQETPAVEYVGAFNSNKYHYRSCKWAKYIGPRSLRVFHSVAEAQKAGYISCPTCKPPLADGMQTSAR